MQTVWSPFQLCSYAGFALSVSIAMALISHLGLSHWVLAVLVLSSVSVHFALLALTRLITGGDRLVFYHDLIAVMGVAAIVLWLMGQPILPYLDVAILGLGILLAWGRLGCLMVGCCHGRPYAWGVCYSEGHTSLGFTPYFVGVRLFPIQAVESLWVAGLVLAGGISMWHRYQLGETLTWFSIAYAIGRFCFEFMRGDAVRPYLGGFSEAQWSSLILTCVIALGELSGIVQFQLLHIAATAGLIVVMLAVAVARQFRKTARHLLLHPRHVDEVARAVEWLADPATTTISAKRAPIKIGTTSLGIQISASTIKQGESSIYHYSLSSQTGTISEEAVRAIARLILQLKHPSGATELTKGNRGVFHVLIYPWKDGRYTWN